MAHNLYLGNLNDEMTEGTLKTLFVEDSEIESVNLITDRHTGRPGSFAFVKVSTEQAAREAMTGLNGKQVDEREINVYMAKPRNDRRGSDGGRSGW